MTELILPHHRLLDGGDTILRQQEITDDFLTACHENRLASRHVPMGEFHQVASIPTAVIDKWMREGFDIFVEPLPAIMKRLRAEDLTAFITTERQVA